MDATFICKCALDCMISNLLLLLVLILRPCPTRYEWQFCTSWHLGVQRSIGPFAVCFCSAGVILCNSKRQTWTCRSSTGKFPMLVGESRAARPAPDERPIAALAVLQRDRRGLGESGDIGGRYQVGMRRRRDRVCCSQGTLRGRGRLWKRRATGGKLCVSQLTSIGHRAAF